MIYCPIIGDYVDQEDSCIGCKHYKELEDSCTHPEQEEEQE
jgi:hypothetical protein